MKRLLFLVISLLIASPLLFADVSLFNKDTFPIGEKEGVSRASKKRKLNALGNLTFFKDFTNVNKDRNPSNILRADYSKGLGTATFTATRSASAPSNYVDASGVIQLVTTSDVPRFQGGYYDETGFHAMRGVMIKGARTNICLQSNDVGGTSWVNTAPVTFGDNDDIAPDGALTASRLTYAGGSGIYSSASTQDISISGGSENKTLTVSIYVKTKTGTSTFRIKNTHALVLDNFSSDLTATTSWRRFSFTVTNGAGAGNGKQSIGIMSNVADGAYDLEVWGAQLEVAPYASSLIPTTDTSLTRGAEVFKYPISGNRTGATESCFIKYAPEWAASAQTEAVYLLDSDADIVDMAFVVASDSFQYRPNGTDDAANVALAASDPAVNTSYVMAGISYGATAGTNAEIYVDEVTKGSTTTNYTAPDMAGTSFYLGSKADGTLQINGVFQSIAFFSEAKSDADVAKITNILNS